MVKRKRLLFIILLLFITLIGCGKQQSETTIKQTGKESGMENDTVDQAEALVEISVLKATVASTESSTEVKTVSPTELIVEASVGEETEAAAVATVTLTGVSTEAVVLDTPVVMPIEVGEATPVVGNPVENPVETPVVTSGRTYGYYTDCTKVGLIEHKTEYGKHLPYEYFSFGSDSAVYCIAYEDDALSYGLKPKFNSLLGLTTTMQEFSNYGKAKGGNGVVGAILLDFGNYNGKRLCVVSVDTN